MADAAEVVARRGERPSFQVSVETRLLYARVRTMQFSEIVQYPEFNGLVDQDVQHEAYAALKSARDIALRDDGIVTVAIAGIGIKRLTDSETVNSGTETANRQRRLARGYMRRAATVDPTKLSEADRLMLFGESSRQAAISLFAKPKALTRILAANTSCTGELPVARTLELFRGPKPS